jgi:hypothetical protein
VSRDPRSHPNPRPRPVTEAPVDALLARADDLARRWVVALILARPLQRISELPLEDLAHEAPVLCAQAIRALASDTELERMAGTDTEDGRDDSPSARRLGALAGARDAGSAVAAVEALRGVLWESLLAEPSWPSIDRSARLVADLADRLAYVCATALAATIEATIAAGLSVGIDDAEVSAAGSGHGTDDSGPSPAAPQEAILIDERDEAGDETGPPAVSEEPRPAEARPSPEARQSPEAHRSPEARRAQVRPLPWDEPSQVPTHPIPQFPGDMASPADQSEIGAAAGGGGLRASQVTSAPEEIEIRDERGEEGPAAWIRSIGRQLERFEHDHLPFAVLLIELGDVARLRRAALPGGVSSLTSRVERVLAQELQRIGDASAAARPAGSLTCERPGRYWLVVPAMDAAAARRLADWLVRTIGPLASRRWAPLEVTVGTAVCPGDGRDAAALAAHADVGLYPARATGRSTVPADESA